MVDITFEGGTQLAVEMLAKLIGVEGVKTIGVDLFDVSGTVIKAKASSSYFYMRNGTSKIQIFYSSKNNTEEMLKPKVEAMIIGAKSFVEVGTDGTLLSDKLSSILGVKVEQCKKEGVSYFRVRDMDGFKSLSLDETGKKIRSATFETPLDITKTELSIETFDEFSEKSRLELETRLTNIKEVLCSITGC